MTNIPGEHAGKQWFHDLLACPDCGQALGPEPAQFTCACGYSPAGADPLDLRPRRPVARNLSIVPGTRAREALAEIPVERPEASVRSPPGARDSSELFSALGANAPAGARFLDLGCGPRDQEPIALQLGMKYCGVDYASRKADVLADAHALPFRPGSFDVVFSYAVLEHLYCPPLALQEVSRVLAPGGWYVGTVAQGEPFHDSYFHLTSWGLLHGLASAGLEPVRIWPGPDTLRSLSAMGRYPRVGRLMLRAVGFLLESLPFLAPRKFFRWSQRQRDLDELHRASAICFLARKPERRA